MKQNEHTTCVFCCNIHQHFSKKVEAGYDQLVGNNTCTTFLLAFHNFVSYPKPSASFSCSKSWLPANQFSLCFSLSTLSLFFLFHMIALMLTPLRFASLMEYITLGTLSPTQATLLLRTQLCLMLIFPMAKPSRKQLEGAPMGC